MPYGEKSAYDAQEKLKGGSPAYKKSTGFKLRSKTVPFKDVDVDEDVSDVDIDPSSDFDPRGSGTYSDYLSSFRGSKYRPKSRSWYGRQKARAQKSGEAGYMGVEALERAGQMGGTAEWEEEELATSGRTVPITKKSPAKIGYFSADLSSNLSPTMKKSSGFKMKGHTLPGIKQIDKESFDINK